MPSTEVAIRYRCTACGGKTRFKVTVTTTITYYHHQTIGGDMNPEDDYTPNPPDTPSERLGATEDHTWTPVRVPGGDQGTVGGRKPDDADQPGVSEEGAEAQDEMDAYDETTGG